MIIGKCSIKRSFWFKSDNFRKNYTGGDFEQVCISDFLICLKIYVSQLFLWVRLFLFSLRKVKEKITYKNVSGTHHSTTKGRRYFIFAWKFLNLCIIFYTTFKSIRSLQLLFRYTFRLKRWRFIPQVKPHTCKELLLVIFRLSSSETVSFAWNQESAVKYHCKPWKG